MNRHGSVQRGRWQPELFACSRNPSGAGCGWQGAYLWPSLCLRVAVLGYCIW